MLNYNNNKTGKKNSVLKLFVQRFSNFSSEEFPEKVSLKTVTLVMQAVL